MFRVFSRAPARSASAFACAVLLGVGFGCRAPEPLAAPAKPAPLRAPPFGPAPVPGDPAAALVGLPALGGFCAQVRAVRAEPQAVALRAQIEAALGVPVRVRAVDLGRRKGTWYRLCAGAFDTAARAETWAAAATADSGALRPFLDTPRPGEPRFFIHTLDGEGAPPPAAQRAMAAGLADRVWLPRTDGWLAVGTGPRGADGADVFTVTAAGSAAVLPDTTRAPCAGCDTAAGVRARTLDGVADLGAGVGRVAFVHAERESGERNLHVVTLPNAAAPAVLGGVLLGQDLDAARVHGVVRAVDADGVEPAEIALRRDELRMLGEHGCDVQSEVEVYRVTPAGLTPVPAETVAAAAAGEAAGRAGAALALLKAWDAFGVYDQASSACGVYLARGHDASVVRYCLGRVDDLRVRGHHVAAVNAAGVLSSKAAALRPAVAPRLYAAADAVEQHPALSVSAPDCLTAPLVPDARGMPAPDALRAARAARAGHVHLADVQTAVFVTALRDYGPETPVGGLVSRWLARLKREAPSRHAEVGRALVERGLPLPEDASAGAMP